MAGINISLASETVAQVGPLEIRNSLLMAWLTMLVLIVFCFILNRTKFRVIPGRFQAMVELVISGLYELFGSVVQDDRLARRFFPLVTTMFIFILMGNWLGILPGVGSIVV